MLAPTWRHGTKNQRQVRPPFPVHRALFARDAGLKQELVAIPFSKMFFATGLGIERSFRLQGPRAMGGSLDEECSASLLNDLCKQWWGDQNLRHCPWNDSAVLVLAAEREKTFQPSQQCQQCCLMNAGFLGPILKRILGARTLKLPGMDVISSELLNLWCKHFRGQDKKRQGKGRLPACKLTS